jgi:hypothetical protein
MKPATVKEVIEQLEKLPQDLPCYFRPKYYGTVQYMDNVPINVNGIGEMHPHDEEKYICFLC